MRIAILSRNKNLHSIRRLLEESRRARVQCDIINPLECQLIIDGKKSKILVGPREIPHFDAVLPRIGASITDYGLAVVKHFEVLGMKVINTSQAIAESRDKMRSLQVLTQFKLQVPPSALTRTPHGIRLALAAVNGLPVVLKVLQGTQGVGVMLEHTPIGLGSVLDTLRGLHQDVIMQKFIAEGAGQDFRVFVIGNRVVAAMLRKAAQGEFRSNIHRGGEGTPIRLPKKYERTAIQAAKILGLQIAGVDLMESDVGPLVIEVNSSPGFEGIEQTTKKNVAALIIRHMLKEARKKRRHR